MRDLRRAPAAPTPRSRTPNGTSRDDERAESDRQRNGRADASGARAPGQPHLAPRVIDVRNAYLVSSLMRDVDPPRHRRRRDGA